MKHKKKFIEKFQEEYQGKDQIRGRPIRMNEVRLKLKPKKDYAQLLFFSDLHYGHPQCKLEKAKEYLSWALKNKVYVLCVGDMMEAGLRSSIGNSVYEQTFNPQEQMEAVIELLRPLAKAGLIIGYHDGNHEKRITKTTGINISKIIANDLDVRYLGYACWSLLRVGKQAYTLYSTHGSSGSRFKHTKMKAVSDLTQWINADIIAMGHVHSKGNEDMLSQRVDLSRKMVVEDITKVILTGAYLGWDDSYAQEKNYPPAGIGSPTAKLLTKQKKVAIQ